MTKEELKRKFPIGSKVKLVNDANIFGVDYEPKAGMTGTVIDVLCDIYDTYDEVCLEIVWDEGCNASNNNYFAYRFELIKETQATINVSNDVKVCPKCGTQTFKKQTEQYGLIDKCPNCLWC